MDDWFLQRHAHPGTRHHLNILLGTKDKLTVGRKAGGSVDIVCNGKTVSREHCYFKFADNCWNVEDLKSMNGIYINKVKIPENIPTLLKVGDTLGIGAIDSSDPDYFVFDILKNVIKEENENGEEIPKGGAQVAPEIPNVAEASVNSPSVDPLGNPLGTAEDVQGGFDLINNNNSEELGSRKESSPDKHKASPIANNFELPSCSSKEDEPVDNVEDVQGGFDLIDNNNSEELGSRKESSSDKHKASPIANNFELPSCSSKEDEPVNKEVSQQQPLNLNNHQDEKTQKEEAQIPPVNSKEEKKKIEDPKLSMRCEVRLEKLPPILGKFAREGSTNIQKLSVNRKKRALPIVDSDDSDDTGFPRVFNKVNAGHFADKRDDRQKNSYKSTTAKGKELKKISHSVKEKRMKDKKQRRNSLDVSYDDSDSGFHAPSTSNFVVEKFKRSTGRVDDDDVILLSSDEETFSQKYHFKIEPEEVPSNGEKSPPVSDGCSLKPVSSSSEDDAPFFPELSQTFLNEIESEELANEDTSVPAKSTSNKDGDRLKDLTSSISLKHKEKTVIPTDPKYLPPRESGRRFSLATGSTRKENDTLKAKDSVDKFKNNPISTSQRTTMSISMKSPNSKKRVPSKINSAKDKMLKNQDFQSYVRSVNQANSRPQCRIPNSMVDCPSIFEPSKVVSKQKQNSDFPKLPKSSAPPPAKAKVTKRSRIDMFTEDLVGAEVNQRQNSGSNPLAGYSIPKKSKVSCGEGDEELKENPSVLDSIESAMECSKAYSFKAPRNRVARKTLDGDGPSTSTYSHKSSPRDEAQPLGKKTKWTPSYSKSTPNTSKNVQEANDEKIGSHEIEVCPPGEEQSYMNCSETRTSTKVSMDVTLPLSALDNEKLSLPNQGTPDVGKTGILIRIPSSNYRRPKKNVRFSDVNDIKEIEARSPNNASSNTTIRSVDLKTLTNDLLLRICNWSYNWIAEQQNAVNRDEPPPLLNEVKSDDNRMLPKLALLPVVSAYHSLEAYFAIFHPLMIHEIWANICKEVDSDPVELKTLVHARNGTVEGCAIFPCETVVHDGFSRFRDMDLVALTVPFPKTNTFSKVFAIVENVELRRIGNRQEIDHRLLRWCPSAEFRVSFALRLKHSANVPMQLANIFTITRIMPLRTVIKQFHLTAELSRSLLCEVILHPSDYAEAFKLDAVDLENHEILNPIQHRAVESIARTIVHTPNYEPKVALLQGPPGTGKSLVIVELILRMIRMNLDEKNGKRPRILICAPSNNAVDEIAYRLCKTSNYRNGKLKIVRIGVPNSMHQNVRNISLEILAGKLLEKDAQTMVTPHFSNLNTLKDEKIKLNETKKKLIKKIEEANKQEKPDEARVNGRMLEDIESRIESVERSYAQCYESHIQHFKSIPGLRDKAKERVVLDADVICTTLNSCRSKEMELLFLGKKDNHREGKHEFLCCIIDEASQCTEPESLTPLSLGISKLVLIGDPDQLPATVASQSALKNRFDQSLFNRFYSSRMADDQENNEPVMMLNTQYRMAPSICEWPSKYFYGGKLVTAVNLPRSGPCYEYRVLNVIDGQEQPDPKDGKSIMNEKEAHLVATAVKVILNSPLTRRKTVGVITFYQSQKQCILNALKTRFGKDVADRVEVNTVDSFQGREKDIVIVSCVRAKETGGDIGFINSLQRMNVALTRAKESLVVCCHFPTLQANEAWNDLINNARNRDVSYLVTSDYTLANLQPLLMCNTP